jgi:dTDP-4-dehydrorhamnose reductase
MRILVLGSNGMLGHKMVERLSRHFQNVIPISRKEDGFDARNATKIREFINWYRADVVVNCVGLVKQRPEAENNALSIAINSLLPHALQEVCAERGTRLIHFSTDCVFSGRRGSYTESDPSDAADLYGRTKYLGEVHAPNALTLRTSIIGREKQRHLGLLDWLLKQDGKEIPGYHYAFYSGVTTNCLADIVAVLIRNQPNLSGLYQIASETTSKYLLLTMLADAYKLNVKINPNYSFFCDRSLIGERFKQATGLTVPSWDEMINDLVKDTGYEPF